VSDVLSSHWLAHQVSHLISWRLFLLPSISCYSDYTIAMKLLAGQGQHSRSRLYPGPAPLFQSTRWFSVKHRLKDWTDGPGRLGVGQPKPLIYTSPAEIWLLLTRRERWVSNILTLIIHWLGPPLFLPWWSEHTRAIWSERLAIDPYQKNTPPTVRLEPAIYRFQIRLFTNWATLSSYACRTIIKLAQ